MSSNISFRKATLEDTAAIFRLFLFSVRDLAYRQGARAVNDGDDPEVIAATWKQRQSMFEHLTRTARHFWVADRDGTLLGYARSILRHDMLELTEFFVSPAAQSGGIGRELLRLAFADTQARLRTVLASTDVRAQSLYLKSGVYPLFPIGHFSRPAEPTTIDSDLHFEPMDHSSETLALLDEVDTTVLGYPRSIDHQWFWGNRDGFLVYRNRTAVGYGYVSRGFGSGPFALLEPADYPAVLAHAETMAARSDQAELALQVPLINRSAVAYLVGRGYRLDPSFMFFMSDGRADLMDRYLITGPPYFV
ncbi:MAG: GNAT family N-acetyltransferase [Anaerolineae bacterium]|uniref:GNAT family N-acetyltransferase n=1 Tax=Promineifilum sp. TaxID=2664178 RepID=UPI001DF588D9|nr:GNAT family N-acetyltransferase [Anaerolineales bacterium]MCB8934170.1 GNAT family N-acetyltransferase [Promineifilum sp.]MCO5179791.1 GNAT family N-acetyltransferase [Promineifilum sp.]MCW5845649.1 GNAT family N-acetyltransferase [Anaerolineae bacterium]